MVGKGGVGKTTTAGALALAGADTGEATHLLSTDPAHSLGDLFGVDLSHGRPTPSPCTGALTLEELDASGLAARWIDRARGPVAELFDLGTYLDPDDVAPFLDLSLPGIDEVAAVLRLAELAEDTDAGRVVVDTAPTGHALRLLDADAVVASWARALHAMGEKAAAVAEGLTHRAAHLEAEDFVDELDARVRRYRESVAGRAAAVVVGRGGSVVEAETRRLESALRERGLPAPVRLRVSEGAAEEPGAPTGGRTVPFRRDLEGCSGLRRWGQPGPAAAGAPDTRSRDVSTGAAGDWIRSLEPRLLLFVGKGGVGKSTCAAAWALELARDRPVTLLGVDPAGSLDDVLGDVGAQLRAEAGAGGPPPDLRVRQVDAAAAYAELETRYREGVAEAFDRIALGRGARLDRRVVESLLDLAPPGLDEIFAVTALLEEVDDARAVVVDTAPTGHLLRLLALPETGLEWTRSLMRILLRYRSVLGLDAFAGRLLDFAKHLKDLHLSLSDPRRAAAVVVRLPGPLVSAETDRLGQRLEEAGVTIAAVIANREPDGSPVPEGARPRPEVPLLVAPALPRGPEGVAELRRFVARWRRT